MLFSFIKDVLRYKGFTVTPSQYFDKNCQDMGNNFGTVIDKKRNYFNGNLKILKDQDKYPMMTSKERFLNAVELPNEVLTDCKNQEDLFNFFLTLRSYSYENNITRSTYNMYWPDPVFSDDWEYGEDLLFHVLKYKNIPKCKVHWKIEKRDKDSKYEYYSEEEWYENKKIL